MVSSVTETSHLGILWNVVSQDFAAFALSCFQQNVQFLVVTPQGDRCGTILSRGSVRFFGFEDLELLELASSLVYC